MNTNLNQENTYTYTTKQDVIDAARSFAQAEYFQSCKSIAQDAIDECPDDTEAQDEHLWESLDGSCWMIYTWRSFEVLRHTNNDDAWTEVGELDKDKAILQMAFWAMLADCRDELQELRDSQETEDEEDNA